MLSNRANVVKEPHAVPLLSRDCPKYVPHAKPSEKDERAYYALDGGALKSSFAVFKERLNRVRLRRVKTFLVVVLPGDAKTCP